MGSRGMSNMGTAARMGLTGMTGLGSLRGSTQSGQFIGANTGQTPFIGGGQLDKISQPDQNFGQNWPKLWQQPYGSQYNRANQQSNSNYGQSGYGQSRNQVQLPPVRRVDIEYTKKSAADISSALSQRLQNTAGLHSLSPLEASFQGDTLILKGVVATDHDRDLAERLAHLEPGVEQIQNDLVVNKAGTPDSKNSSPH